MFPFWIEFSATSLLDWLPLVAGGLIVWLAMGLPTGHRA
jgi:hypothetical protein